MKCEFELDDLMRAFIGVRVDNVLAILNALGVDLSAEECRFQFQGVRQLERVGSTLEPKHTNPVPFAGLSSELRPEIASGQTEFHQTLTPPAGSLPQESK